MTKHQEIGGDWDGIWGNLGVTADALEEQIWDRHIGLIHTEYYEKTMELVSSAERVLEAGCGIGRWVKYLQDQGTCNVGADLSESAAECWRVSQLCCTFADIRILPFPEECFDVILSWGVLEHFQDKQQVVVTLRESKRVLKQGGLMLITIPYMNALHLISGPYWWFERQLRWRLRGVGLLRRLLKRGRYTPQVSSPPFFEYKYLRREFESFIREAGLRIESVKAISHEFGLLTDLPLPIFKNGPPQPRYSGASKLGRQWLIL